MAKQLQLRRGTTSQHSTFTGADGEVTIDTDKKVVVVHDGTTAGGIPLAKQITVDTKVSKVTSTNKAIARFDGASGQIQNSGVIIDDNNNVGISTSSPNAKVSIGVGTGTQTINGIGNLTNTSADTGSIQIGQGDTSSSFRSGIVARQSFNSSTGYTDSIVDFYVNKGGIGQSKAMTLDASGKLLLQSGAGGLGYGTGAGGVVTQLTNKNTAVTLNKPCGTITCSNSSLGANGHGTFLLYNSLIQAGDQLLVNMVYGTGTANVYTITSEVGSPGGVASIGLWNFNQSTAFSEAIQIRFSIIKGATA